MKTYSRATEEGWPESRSKHCGESSHRASILGRGDRRVRCSPVSAKSLLRITDQLGLEGT